MLTPNEVLGALETFQASIEPAVDDVKRAAVCMIIQNTAEGLALLMIKRADYDGDPWSGQMAFPGGRVELDDESPKAAALRECVEEVGVDLRANATFVGPLSEIRATLRGRKIDMIVSPYVFFTEQTLVCTPNYEVAKTVSIPLSFLLDEKARDSFELHYDGKDNAMPCYYYQGDKVWGLSLRFIDELRHIIKR